MTGLLPIYLVPGSILVAYLVVVWGEPEAPSLGTGGIAERSRGETGMDWRGREMSVEGGGGETSCTALL